MLPLVSIKPGTVINLWFQVQHSPFWPNVARATQEIIKLLFMHHLIFGLRWFNRAWIYKDPKVSVLQTNVTFIERFVHFLHFKLMSQEPMSLISSGMLD